MSDFRERMRLEHNELVDKIHKLDVFLSSAVPTTLSVKSQSLLREQLVYMKGYERVLAERICISLMAQKYIILSGSP